MLLEIICYSLSGFFMKFSDESYDEKNNRILAIISGVLCVLFTIIVCVNSADASCIFISVLIANILALKVDSINHIISALMLILILYIIGIPYFSLVSFIICVIAAYLDEKINDIADKKEDEGVDLSLLYKLFKYRYSLKIAVLLLSVLGLLNINPLNSIAFNPLTIIYFYLFDLSYELCGKSFNTIYNLI